RLPGAVARGGVDERGYRGERGAAGNAALFGGETDAVAVLHRASGGADHRLPVAAVVQLVRFEIGDGVDHQRGAPVLDDVDDVGTAVADLGHRHRADAGGAERTGRAGGGVEGEAEAAQLREHGQGLRLVDVGDAAQRPTAHWQGAEGGDECLVQRRLQVDVDAHDLSRRFHLRTQSGV